MVEWVRDTKRSQTQCVSTTGPRETVGEKGRVGEWERDTKRSHTQCVSPEGRGRQEGPRGRLKSALKSARMRLDSLMELKFFSVLSLSPLF